MSENNDKEPPVFIALLCITAGIYPLLLSLDIIPDGSKGLNAPVWVGVVASSVFILAGVALLTKKHKGLNQFFGIMIMLAFSAIGNWVAFGVGERTCGVEIFVLSQEASGILCRIPFGYGAILVNGLILAILFNAIAKRLKNEKLTKLLNKANKVVLLIIFFPLLVLMIIPLIYKAGKEYLANNAR